MPTRERKGIVVVGVDVGGAKKGFHAVALRGGQYETSLATKNAAEIADWCRNIVRAQVVGVDAPCRWSTTGRARPAERELMDRGVWCFSTPCREVAESHPKNHYGWMLNGAGLFEQLEKTFRLFDGTSANAKRPVCLETFPHAIACAFSGKTVSAKEKRKVRRRLLERAGVETSALTNIDWIDAALCAVAAHRMVKADFKAYGEPKSGLIVVPARSL